MRALLAFVALPLAVVHNILVCGVAAEMPGRRLLALAGTQARADSVRGHVDVLVSADTGPKCVTADTISRDRVDRRDCVPSEGKLNQCLAREIALFSLRGARGEIHRAWHIELDFSLVEQAGRADRHALAAVGHRDAHREVVAAPGLAHQCLDVIELALAQQLGVRALRRSRVPTAKARVPVAEGDQ